MRYESPIHEKGPNRFTFLPRREAFSVLILPFSTHIYYELVFKHPSSPILHYSREHSERCKSALQPSRTGWKLAANEVTIMRVFNSNLLFTRTHLNGRSWYVHKRAIKWLKRVTSKQCLIYYLGVERESSGLLRSVFDDIETVVIGMQIFCRQESSVLFVW